MTRPRCWQSSVRMRLRLVGVFSDLSSKNFEFVTFTAEVIDPWTRNGRNLSRRATETE
jgi:hypothetical protein